MSRPPITTKCACGHLGIHHLRNDLPHPCMALAGDCPCAAFKAEGSVD